jgi:hypothetical protein
MGTPGSKVMDSLASVGKAHDMSTNNVAVHASSLRFIGCPSGHKTNDIHGNMEFV